MPLYSQQFNRTPPPSQTAAVLSSDSPSGEAFARDVWERLNQLIDDCNRLAERVAFLEAAIAKQTAPAPQTVPAAPTVWTWYPSSAGITSGSITYKTTASEAPDCT